ncbi:MAG: SDR family NAD(P)-dependent oxidoreductase [Saprospiraceae bacterium]|nr:SDR family NAD(P)-dependent oxidoreductase [Saprospiraceae bacterium]
MHTFCLAYSPENTDLADRLVRDLQPAGIHFNRLIPDRNQEIGRFSASLFEDADPLVLLITDNFLKDEYCMAGALHAVKYAQKNRHLLLVVADGRTSTDGGHTWTTVPTAYERMVNAIRYMNYWQDHYLQLIENAQHSPDDADRHRIEAHMEKIKDISVETGDFLNLLRDTDPVHWPAFTANRYKHFFQHFNLLNNHLQMPDATQSPAPPPVRAPEVHTAPAPVTETVAAPQQAPVVHIPGPLIPRPAAPDPLLRPIPDDFQEDNDVFHTESFAASEDKPFLIEEPALPASKTPAKAVPYPKEETAQVVLDAHFWLDRGDLGRGLDVFREALDRQPDNADLRISFLRALLDFAHDPDEAGRQLEWLHDLGLPEANSYELMGDIAAARGDHLFAKYCWDRVAEIQPDFSGIFRKLGLLTSEHLTDYKETAMVYLRKAIERNEADGRVYLRLATLLMENGRRQEAELAYQSAIALQPELQTREHEGLWATSPEIPAEAPEVASGQATQVQPEQKTTAQTLTVLITGATSGIGRATAELFAQKGHRLILVGRREDRLAGLKSHFATEYNNEAIHTLTLDVRNRQAVDDALGHLPEAWQAVDVLINNAGLAKGLAPIHEGNIEHWETMIDTNIKGLLYVSRCITPGMVARKKGHIINIGSSAGKEVYKNGNVYCATKFAVDALTQGMRLDLFEHNVRVSQISPGHVENTEFAITRFDGDADRARIYEDFQPLKAADVADAIYFAATRPSHVNIQDVWMFSTQQGSSTMINRTGRD